MKRVVYSMCLLFSFSLAASYEEAELLEKNGNYKEAMIIYKKIAKEKELESNFKKEDSFTKVKNEFYKEKIDVVENKETNKSIKQSIVGDFDLHPYKKMYFMPVTYDFNKTNDRENLETEFQISLEKPLLYNVFGFEETLSVAYTQKSFWQTFDNSAPFRENNYEPEFFVNVPFDKYNLKKYKIAINHQSNGQSESTSRSWNRLYLEGTFQFENLFVTPKIWYRIPEKKGNDENPNIQDYLGYGDIKFAYFYNQNLFELVLRNNLDFDKDNKGSGEFTWTFPLPIVNKSNVYGMINLFSGYGNSLIDYDRKSNKVGFGIALTR